MSHGYVYILTNPSIPGLLKIGMTTKSVEVRAKQLHETGVPTPFIIEYSTETIDCRALESRVHGNLFRERVSHNREFFKLDLEEAIDAVESACKAIDPEYEIRREVAVRLEKKKFLEQQEKEEEAKLREVRRAWLEKKESEDKQREDIKNSTVFYAKKLLSGEDVSISNSTENQSQIYENLVLHKNNGHVNFTDGGYNQFTGCYNLKSCNRTFPWLGWYMVIFSIMSALIATS